MIHKYKRLIFGGKCQCASCRAADADAERNRQLTEEYMRHGPEGLRHVSAVCGFRIWRAAQMPAAPTLHYYPRAYSEGPWRLLSLTTDFRWYPGQTHHAGCLVLSGIGLGIGGASDTHRNNEPIPAGGCACGFWMFDRLEDAKNMANTYRGSVWSHLDITAQIAEMMETPSSGTILRPSAVVGLVMGWGRMARHEREGFRVERLKVLAFLNKDYPGCESPATPWRPQHRADMQALATEYQVPLLGEQALLQLQKDMDLEAEKRTS